MSGDQQTPARQLVLGLPHRPAMGRADFLTGQSNAAAVALVDAWPAWPERGAFLIGPAGSGKSHLTEIWRQASGGVAVAAAALSMDVAEEAAAAGAVAIEDLHAGLADEAALFHLLNLARERGLAVLLTSRVPASGLAIRLPDLASRLRAAETVVLAAPDDELIRRVLVKLFADRQLAVAPAVVDYLVLRMERSLEAANAMVARLDEDALAEGRAITRRLAAAALAVPEDVEGADDD